MQSVRKIYLYKAKAFLFVQTCKLLLKWIFEIKTHPYFLPFNNKRVVCCTSGPHACKFVVFPDFIIFVFLYCNKSIYKNFKVESSQCLTCRCLLYCYTMNGIIMSNNQNSKYEVTTFYSCLFLFSAQNILFYKYITIRFMLTNFIDRLLWSTLRSTHFTESIYSPEQKYLLEGTIFQQPLKTDRKNDWYHKFIVTNNRMVKKLPFSKLMNKIK